MPGRLLLLGGAWGLWCGAHSLLARPSVVRCVKNWLGPRHACYRFLYNIVSLVSLVPVLQVYLWIPGKTVLFWPGWLWPVPWCMRGLAIYLLLAGGHRIDMCRFLGVVPGKPAGVHVQTGSEPLVVDGIFRYIRHPWYLAGLLLLWGRDLAARDLVTAVLLSVYLYLGSVFEERRLLAEYGESYRRYREEVPRFCPRFRLPRRR